MSARPAIDGWFTTGDAPALLGSRCTTCTTTYFPPLPADRAGFCRNPACAGEDFDTVELSRRGSVWSYTDAQYQPPAPYVARTDPYKPFALAAVELAEGITVLGQVADGYGVRDLRVGAEVELVVETLNRDDDGDDLLIWRWKPVTELGEEADQ
ncbi:Zn-ribbon domain-containing OB-fold protein [Nocardioides dilutus]